MRLEAVWHGLLAAALAGGVARAADLFATHDLATHTLGAALEGLSIAPDGAVIVTSNFDKLLLRWQAGASAFTTFATLPAYPQVVITTNTGFLVTAHGKLPFRPGGPMPFGPPKRGAPPMKMPDFGQLETRLLVLDRAGQVQQTLLGPSGAFFNGLAQGSGLTLIADSVGGRIWQADLAHGTVTPWLTDALLLPVAPRPFPGANGLKIRHGTVYVANSTSGMVYTIHIGADGRPKGALKQLATVAGPDDFDVASDGTVFMPTGGSIARISPSGVVTMGDRNCVGCDAALLHDQEHSLLLVTHITGKGRLVEASIGQ